MGDARTDGNGEGAYDLFDRWLAHREDAGEVQQAAPATTFENPLFADTTTARLEAPEVPAPEVPAPQAPAPQVPTRADEPVPADRRPEHDAARVVLAAFADTRAEAATSVIEPPPPEADPIEPADEPPAPARTTAPAPVAEGMPAVVEFAPRRGVRRVVGVLLLVALTATALTAYAAWQDRTTTNIGIAATLGVLTGIIWAVRSGSSVAVLSVRGGMLVVERAGGRHQFDLASHYTPVEIVGEPGRRGWKVLFHRRSMAPFVVDASMVDPAEFTRVVRYYRPED